MIYPRVLCARRIVLAQSLTLRLEALRAEGRGGRNWVGWGGFSGSLFACRVRWERGRVRCFLVADIEDRRALGSLRRPSAR